MNGYSLSACILQIAAGLVNENAVDKIVAGTAAKTNKDFEEVLAKYQALDWRDYPQASDIARRFWNDGKIEQPRLRLFGKAPDISSGVWK